MVEGGEVSSSDQIYPDGVTHAPVTPAKQGERQSGRNSIQIDWRKDKFDDDNGGMLNRFPIGDVDTWQNISCINLLALAAAKFRKGSDDGGSRSGGAADTSLQLGSNTHGRSRSSGGSTQFTPATPDEARREQKQTVTIENPIISEDANLEKGLTEIPDLNETPPPKQRRRKHRPKVVTESRPKRGRRPAAPKADSSSTGKRKYVRRKGNEKSTETIFVSGSVDPSQETKKSCKRKITFDELEQGADMVVKKSEVDRPVDKTTVKVPVTPSKTDHAYGKEKHKMNFLQGIHDKGASRVSSPNESNCSTTACFSNREDGRHQLRGENALVCQESLAAYLSTFTDYQGGIYIPVIHNKDGRHQRTFTQLSGYEGSSQQSMFMEDFQTKKRKTKSSMVSSLYNNHLCFTNHIGYPANLERKSVYGIDGLVSQFKRLDIDTRVEEKDREAVIPYSRGYRKSNAFSLYQQNRSIVPYEGLFNPIKKRKARPKVDLDEETGRVWRLLLEHINSKGIDGTDEAKEKWWEEERRVFHGRADSFIARMHLVQGDRRFSRWKGSVLDSVIGVFLTQNVSDHLSSSAFMSLAARYPLKSNSGSKPLQEEPILSVEEPREVDQNETVGWQEKSKSNQPSGDHDPKMLQDADSFEEKEVGSNEFSKYSVDFNDNSECKISELSEKDLAMYKKTVVDQIEADKVSSQNSADASPSSAHSPIVYTLERLRSCSMHNSEELKKESKPTVLNGCPSFVELLHMQGSTTVDETYSQRQSVYSEVGGSEAKKESKGKKQIEVDWDSLRSQAEVKQKRERTLDTMDSLDYDAVRNADVSEVADAIKERGMNNRLAARIKDLLDRLVRDHGNTDLEWLRDVPPDKAKEYLLSFRGLGLKSVECVRLLTLHHLAFPVDTNVGRIAVRLGWVPLQPLPESLQLHLLELYPMLESIQQYLWPRLCKLDQRTLYELHYQMITFGKVFCTKSKPNCNACPMRGECRHFASAFASARLALPAPEERIEKGTGQNAIKLIDQHQPNLPLPSGQLQQLALVEHCNPLATPVPIVEVAATPEPIVELPATPEQIQPEFDIEDFCEDTEEIPMIKLNIEEFTQNLQTYMEKHMELGICDMSKALVALTSEAAAIPTPKLKNVINLRTEHQVYELPDSHPLLDRLDPREPDDPCSYLLAIWTPGETASSVQPPGGQCCSPESGTLCNDETCSFCNSTREANSHTVRGTLLIPCRTAMRGSFPLNGTYFQVNEVFADHESSLNPIDIPRSMLWNLPRRMVYFGTSIPTIFKGMTTEDIQHCFWRGFVCVRGFDQKTRAPRPLMARLHFPASKTKRSRKKTD